MWEVNKEMLSAKRSHASYLPGLLFQVLLPRLVSLIATGHVNGFIGTKADADR